MQLHNKAFPDGPGVLLLCYSQKKLDAAFSGKVIGLSLYIDLWSYSSMLGCWMSLQHFQQCIIFYFFIYFSHANVLKEIQQKVQSKQPFPSDL